MKTVHFLQTRLCRFLLHVVGYIAALTVMRHMSWTVYRLLFRSPLVSWYFDLPVELTLMPALALFLLAAALLGLSVWQAAGAGGEGFFARLDLTFLLLGAACGMSFCVYYLRTYMFFEMLLLASMVCYWLGMSLFCAVIARLRRGTLVSGFVWLRFFRVFPARRGMGLCMVFLLAVNVLLFLTCLLYENDLLILVFAGGLAVLSQMAKQMLALSGEYAEANAKKLRAERFKAELITNVSHDIRTPLTSLISYVDLLKRLPVQNEEFHAYTAILETKSARLKTLIDDLMEASKASAGSLNVQLQAVDLYEITGQITGEFDDVFTARGLVLVQRAPEEPLAALADSAQLWRVLENLFGNAAKYALPDTRVFAELAQRNGGVCITLKNTSEAPLETVAEELTEQFIRGDRARHTEGNGLGLYIAKSLTELMRGRLTIRVSGDLFEAEVWLPFCPGAEHAAQAFEPPH